MSDSLIISYVECTVPERMTLAEWRREHRDESPSGLKLLAASWRRRRRSRRAAPRRALALA